MLTLFINVSYIKKHDHSLNAILKYTASNVHAYVVAILQIYCKIIHYHTSANMASVGGGS
jgi:hypothetical protein